MLFTSPLPVLLSQNLWQMCWMIQFWPLNDLDCRGQIIEICLNCHNFSDRFILSSLNNTYATTLSAVALVSYFMTCIIIGDLFDMLLPMLCIYQEYVRNHHYSLQVLAEYKQKPEFNNLLKRYEEKPACETRTLEIFLTYPMHQVSILHLM
jgi:hypothetical protein